jgi:hypothetical protein
MKNFYFKNKKIFNIILVIIFSITFFSFANVCYAGAIDAAVITLIGWIASLIIVVCGWVLGMAIKAILVIANYNNFINETTIIDAWIIVRDLCNMFFVLILLVIAFATILRIESYNVKKLLPKLLIMAVLINFSRTIVGLMIDFSQVIMLTFVSAFSDGGGNFIKALRVDDFLAVAKDNKWGIEGKELNLTNTVAAMIVAIIFLIIATIVMLAILVVLVMRVIMFWIYIVLSPLAFLLSAFPGGQKYASQYWGEFTKYLVNGPVLAFFIWLSLITMNNLGEFSNSAFFIESQTIMLPDTTAVSGILFDRNFMAFIMAIGFLVGGLMVSSQIGGIGASWGASTVKGLGARGIGLGKKGVFGIGRGAKDLTLTAGRKVDTLQMKGQVGLAKLAGRDKYIPKSLNVAQMKKGWDASRLQAKDKYERGEGFSARPSDTYRDIVNKYASFPQYLAVKKGKGRQDADRGKADRLRFEARRLNERSSNAQLTDPDEIDMRMEKYNKKEPEMLEDYIKYAPPEYKTPEAKKDYADKEFFSDIESITESNKFNSAEAEEKAGKKEKEAENLEDPRRTIPLVGWKAGSKAAALASNVDYEFARKGPEEDIDKEQGVLKRETQDNSGAIVEQILKSLDKKETSKVVAGFRLLSQNNDVNEALKDKRVISLMTKSNGLLEKLAESKTIKGLNMDTVKDLKNDFRNNPVSEANAQVMIQGMFKELGLGRRQDEYF